jgi:hypothetical protein
VAKIDDLCDNQSDKHEEQSMRRKLELTRVTFWTPNRLKMLLACTFLVLGLFFVVSEFRTRSRPTSVNPQLQQVVAPAHGRPERSQSTQPDWLQVQTEIQISPAGVDIERDNAISPSGKMEPTAADLQSAGADPILAGGVSAGRTDTTPAPELAGKRRSVPRQPPTGPLR